MNIIYRLPLLTITGASTDVNHLWYTVIMEASSIEEAIYNRAVTLLARREYSERKLSTKLLNLKRLYPHSALYQAYTPELVSRVLTRLVDCGIVDERRALRSIFDSSNGGRYGIHRIKLRVLRNGYRREYVEEIMTNVIPQERDYSKIILLTRMKQDAWREKYAQDRGKTASIPSRVRAYLAQKGFTRDECEIILSGL